MTMLRTFIAVDISDSQRQAAARLQENLQKGIQFTKSYIRWVKPEAMHLTLKFLAIPRRKKCRKLSSVQSCNRFGRHLSFSLLMRGLGFFPQCARAQSNLVRCSARQVGTVRPGQGDARSRGSAGLCS